jgi:hypothetical protein
MAHFEVLTYGLGYDLAFHQPGACVTFCDQWYFIYDPVEDINIYSENVLMPDTLCVTCAPRQ